MGCCSSCLRGDNTGSYIRSDVERGGKGGGNGSGGGQRLGTAAEHEAERRRKAEEAAAARASADAQVVRRIDPNLSDAERKRQRELRVSAAEKRTEKKKAKDPVSRQEFRNPNKDSNLLQHITDRIGNRVFRRIL